MTDNNNNQQNFSEDEVIQELQLTLKLHEKGGSLEANFSPKLHSDYDENNKQSMYAYEAYRLFEKMIDTDLPFAIIYSLITSTEDLELDKVMQVIGALQATNSATSSNKQKIH